MRFLCLVLTIFLLVSLTVPGYGLMPKYCHTVGYCSDKCAKGEMWSSAYDCKSFCCVPYIWKGK
ncbi:CYGN protein, partial [Halcyon senegalensis]|nr:CYGN protein [Halcyon senegalensis]